MPEPSRWWEFEQFVREILERTPGVWVPGREGVLFSTSARKDAGFDIEARRRDRPLLVEIKSETPQTRARLSSVMSQLRAAAEKYVRAAGQVGGRSPSPELLAIFPGVLSRSRLETSLHGEVEIWDGRYLQSQARLFGLRAPDFVAAPEGEESAEDLEP